LIDLRALGAVAAGGALGSVARFLVQLAFLNRLGAGFPYGTLTVNLVGSFCIGAVAELALLRGLDPLIRTFVIVGILGGFTTFSSFSIETVQLIRTGDYFPALVYVAGSVVLGLAAAFGGIAAVRTFAP
jgi:CrcB protein